MDSIFYWLIVIGVAWLLVKAYLLRHPNDEKSPLPKTQTPPSSYTWPELEEFDFEIVGENSYQKAIKTLASTQNTQSAEIITTADIVLEDNNPYDDKAVRIDIQGKTVGYMSREDARRFRRRLTSRKLGKATTTCKAMIVGGHQLKNSKNHASYGVKLDIKPFD